MKIALPDVSAVPGGSPPSPVPVPGTDGPAPAPRHRRPGGRPPGTGAPAADRPGRPRTAAAPVADNSKIRVLGIVASAMTGPMAGQPSSAAVADAVNAALREILARLDTPRRSGGDRLRHVNAHGSVKRYR